MGLRAVSRTFSGGNGPGGVDSTRQVLISGTTYTTPANCAQIRIRMVGGGGGGNGGAGSTPGSAGGASSFNSVTAAGGTYAQYPTIGAQTLSGNGTGSPTGIFRAQGQVGAITYDASSGYGGPGGASLLGPGGPGGFSGAGGNAPANSGGGGGGAFRSPALVGGGGGTAGEYVEFIINSPSATYTYAIGTSGAGATGTGTGGAGGSGVILVDEYY